MVYLQYVRYLQFNFHWILEPIIFGQIRGQWAVLSLSAPAALFRGDNDELFHFRLEYGIPSAATKISESVPPRL